jgi:hypothetical protein
MSMKNPLTLAGIEPETFRFVAQHLNHCDTAVVSASREDKWIRALEGKRDGKMDDNIKMDR